MCILYGDVRVLNSKDDDDDDDSVASRTREECVSVRAHVCFVCVCVYRSRAPCTLLYVNSINPHDCARNQIQLLFII
jgi:hypothetical protein